MQTLELGNTTPVKVQNIGFLLVDNFALVPFSSAIETLRMANQVAGQRLFNWSTISLEGEPVVARCGLEVSAKCSTQSEDEFSIIFICGGTRIASSWSNKLNRWLHKMVARGAALGALSTASYLLARAGLLNGYRCTVHWDNLSELREEHPLVTLTDNIYEIDRDRYTCAGGTTAIDMMLHLIAMLYSRKLCAAISDNLLIDRVRCMTDKQRIPLTHQIGHSQPRITEAAYLMENNLEEPLSPDELASYVNISRRQLERLYRTHLNCSLHQYYNQIRLEHARRLLIKTEKSILEISQLCGFNSSAHFSKNYRQLFGMSPREARSSLSLWDEDTRAVS
jgi:AraC family transcriptional regulator, glycine betaine-responsive activator